MNLLRIKDVFKMTEFFNLIDNPLWENQYDSMFLNVEFLTKYGEKPIAPLVEYFVKDGKLTIEDAANILSVVYYKNQESWKRRFEVLDITYNVLDNYMMTETENVDRDETQNTISELLRSSNGQSKQINELVTALKMNHEKTMTLNQKDKTVETGKTAAESSSSELSKNTQTTDTADKLEFLNRVDSEDRDITKTLNKTDTESVDESDTLSFVNRKDTTESTRRGTATEKEDATGKETGESTEDVKNKNGLFGFNGHESPNAPGYGSRPTTTTDGTNESNTVKNTETEGNRESTTQDNANESLTKNGSETHSIDRTATNTVKESDQDKGVVNNRKSGSEINSKTGSVKEDVNVEGAATNNTLLDNNVDVTSEGTNKDIGTTDSTTSNTGTVTDIKEEETTDNTSTDVKGGMKEERTLTRTGNIGVMTTADILRSHIDFWKFSFVDEMFNDVKNMLALDIYE